MSQNLGPETPSSLLPAEWYKSIRNYMKLNAHDGFQFLALNLLLGTCGIWFPLVYTLLTSGDTERVYQDLMRAGALYLFAIPFLASILYAALEIQSRSEQAARRNQYNTYVTILTVFSIVLAFLSATSFSDHVERITLREYAQWVAAISAVFVATSIFSLMRIDSSQSVADDINSGAEAMAAEAHTAKSNERDFE